MRAFAWFLGTLLAAALAAAALAYPVFELTSRVASWPFHRVAARLAMLAAAAGLYWLCRRLGIATKRGLGYGLPRRRFFMVCAVWGALGIVTGGLGAGFLLAAHLRTPTHAAASTLHLLLVALSSGIAVALIEETVMRGAMHTAIARESGELAAALLTAPLFAVLHFFARAHIPADQVHWMSGFDLLARSFAPLGSPALVLDAFLAWLAVGLLLSLTRVLTGNIAVSIGLHAGWVVVLRVLMDATAPGRGVAFSSWVGAFDGLLGYWILPWSAGIALALWLARAAWVPYASGAGVASGASDASLSSRSSGSTISR
jgi:membrane protease YdiL (CAAX protease family)